MQASFGVSEFTTWHLSFEEDVALYLDLGIDAIEVCERKLSNDLGKAKEQLAYLKATGLEVCSIQPRVHALFNDSMCPELHDPLERIARYKQSIDLFSEFFPNAPMVTISGNAPNNNYRLAFETAHKLYPDLADYAADKGMSLMFEPLNPILMNNDSFICSLDAGLALIEKVNRPNFGLMLDIWHVWHELNIYERIAKLDGLIKGVHISDWPTQQPRATGDRLNVGDGCIDLASLLTAIKRSGYKGSYCLEIFSEDHLEDSLWQQNPKDILLKNKQAFTKAWEASHD